MWYVVQVRSGEEQDCVLLCKKRMDSNSYREIFVPMYIDKKHFRKKWHDIRKVLFPGYFFIDSFDVENVRQELKKIDRFTRILCRAEQISAITKEEQRFLSQMMDDDYIVHCSRGLIIGDKICITEGPLRDHCGYIKRVDRHRRIAKLEVDISGRMTPAEVGLEILVRMTDEEFAQWKEKRIAKEKTHNWIQGKVQNCDGVSTADDQKKHKKGNRVLVVSGAFEGMSGTLLSTKEERDEWRVRIKLFKCLTEVVFKRREIQIYYDNNIAE